MTTASLWRNSRGGSSWCWNATAVRHAARAFSRSVIPAFREDRSHASRLLTSRTLSESTWMLDTTPTGGSAARAAAGGTAVTRRAVSSARDIDELRDRGGEGAPAARGSVYRPGGGLALG